MMKIPLYQIDAFTDRLFGGNPAAVCPLDTWLDDALMQQVAAENNLSETAFFVAEGDAWRLRWFTPTIEVPLCGHATLASAYVLLTQLRPDLDQVAFETLSGRLTVARQGDRLRMDFPSRPAAPCEVPSGMVEALGATPAELHKAYYYMAVFESEEEVTALQPDFAGLKQLDQPNVIVTAPGQSHDCVSRFFAPGSGIDEDPVTGSVHCTIVPYWAERLGKPEIRAFQASRRGGELLCTHHGDRVDISGACTFYMKGEIELPEGL